MTKDKQIEEMAKALTSYEYKLCERLPKDKCLLTSAVHAQVSCDYCKIAEFLVNAGYRKASEVALEVIEEAIELARHSADEAKVRADNETNVLLRAELRGQQIGANLMLYALAKLKKKYTGE